MQAYTILESSTKSVFLHVTVSESPAPTWGDILKSNSNGTYFGISVDYVNRNDEGYVDFEKMVGLDGIALINVVSNPHDAPITGVKEVQTRITHNDGGSWKTLAPPLVDSQGNKYDCDSTVRYLIVFIGFSSCLVRRNAPCTSTASQNASTHVPPIAHHLFQA